MAPGAPIPAGSALPIAVGQVATGNTVKVALSENAPALPAVRYMEIPTPGEWPENERRKEKRARETLKVGKQ